MEALANYSALLYLEKRKGEHTVDEVLADYRTRLLSKNDEGNTIESTGPIVWGGRLTTSQTPAAWRVITYEKGSWIMHMLRQRMGRERFLDMLGELRKRYEFRTVTTGEFRAVAAEALPPGSVDPKLESFFEQWVYSIGIPALKMSYSVDGKVPRVRLKGTVTQGEVSDDFSVWIPIEIQFPKGKPILHWVKTSTGSVPFSVNLRQAPSKVLLDPDQSVLRR
jgi:aminopeptidase N